jgi:SAM-dependent methyltransferase
MGWRSDAARNRAEWTEANAQYTGARALDAWRREEIVWGVWKVPESALRVLPDVNGMDVVELGCGTAYVGAWLANRGARVVGVDITPAQLETARECMRQTGIELTLIEADAGETGLADASADLVISEYGASIWVDPRRWIAEAARLLRPEGLLVFLCNSTLSILCAPDEGTTDERLHRPQFGMYRFEWPGEQGVNFHLAHGEWIDVLRANGFEIERLVELQAPESAETHPYYNYVTADWARKWPAEEIWVARKRP